MKRAFLIFISLLIFNNYNIVAKKIENIDLESQYAKAIELYNKGKYYKCISILNKLLLNTNNYIKAFNIKIYIAYCNFYEKNYVESANHFRNIINSYPTNNKTEELMYMEAYSLYKKPFSIELDSSLVASSIELFNDYLDLYPKGIYAQQARKCIEDLEQKIVLKSFRESNLYYKLGNYKAALFTLNNLKRKYNVTFIEDKIINFTKLVTESLSNEISSNLKNKK